MNVSMPSITLEQNLVPDKFMWLWAKYVVGVNDMKHCTNCLSGRYSKILSRHNRELMQTPLITLNEQPQDRYSAIYICGVIRKGYPRSNYIHNLHAVIRPLVGQSDTFTFESWQLRVTNGVFDHIPLEKDLPNQYSGLPSEFTTCRIFRWAVCSDLNRSEPQTT
jgi:hypothetical protein